MKTHRLGKQQRRILRALKSGSKTAPNLGGTASIYRSLNALKKRGLVESRRMDAPVRLWLLVKTK